jgi:hypothetical protein
MQSVNCEPFKLSVVTRNVVMLNVVAPTGEDSASFIDIKVACRPFESNNTSLYARLFKIWGGSVVHLGSACPAEAGWPRWKTSRRVVRGASRNACNVVTLECC